MDKNVRFVRCPRCRNVLPEPENIPVYQCGGCGAVLQAKKKKKEDDSLEKQKMGQLSDEQTTGITSDQHSPVTTTDEPSNGNQDTVKKPEIEAASTGIDKKTEIEKVSDEQEPSSNLKNQESLVKSIDETDRNNDHMLLLSKPIIHNEIMKRKMGQVSDDQDRQSPVNLTYELDRNNDPRSSTELSGHEDPESSPEAITHNRIEKNEDQDHDEEDRYHDATSGGSEHFSVNQKPDDEESDNERSNQQQSPVIALINEPIRNNDSCSSEISYHEDLESSPDHDQNRVMFPINNHKIGNKFEESSSMSEFNEIECEPRKIVRESDFGSKSSFKSLIAEKLLDTRQKKPTYLDDDGTISEDGSADLCHRRRFDRVSSTETFENGRFGGTSNYYGYEGSVSSFDGNDNRFTGKNRTGPIRDERFDSANGDYYHRRREHRSMDIGSFYGNRSDVKPENPKMERLELLKMVRDLQDQLERTNVSNPAPQVPLYCSHFPNRPYGHRMAFSGETTSANRRHSGLGGGGGQCHHCYPQDRHFSAQLPQQHVYVNGPGPYYVPSTYYGSHLSSPQHNSESEFSVPVRFEPEPENHHRRPHRNEKQKQPKKRYVRPIAGGSPWVSCYRCSELLQLPQSFLVFKKRCHSLRCGGCMKVLNFTVSDGTHVSRYYPEESIAAPPCSEVEEYADLRAGQVSCSDRSFQKSCSTETDRNGSASRDRSSRRPPSSASSSKKISRRRNTTSEIEEVEPAASGSPLHRLMGYASPSKVIRG